MPLIHVTMIEGRTAEQKRALLDAITSAAHEALGAPLDSIRAWVTDVPAEQFMAAGTLASAPRLASTDGSAAAGPGPDPLATPILPPGGGEPLP